MEACFLEGRYGNGSTNEVQRIAREVLARQHLEQRSSGEASRSKPLRARIDPAVLNPLHGLKGVAAEVEVAKHLDMSAGAVSNRIQTKRFLAAEPTPPIPMVPLTAAQIEAGGRELRQRITEAIAQETFLRQYSRTIDQMSRPRTCVRCRTRFAYVDSINAWGCRGHSDVHDGRQWLCCGNPVVPSDIHSQRTPWSGSGYGCTPMDHTDLDLDRPGVVTGDAWWKVPVELVRMFGERRFWFPKVMGEVRGAEHFAVIWDVRDKQDIDLTCRARRMADGPDGLDDPDSDDEDRVIVESRVKRGKWATRVELRDELESRYSLDRPVNAQERAAYNREASKKDFVFLPSSPIASGPTWLVGTNRFDLVARGPDVLKHLH